MLCKLAAPRESAQLNREVTYFGWSRLFGDGMCPRLSIGSLVYMNQQGIKQFSLIGACGTSVAFALYAGWLFSRGHEPNKELFRLYEFVVSFLMATWLVADTTQSRRTQPSFDLGWFIVLAFPVYLVYHLISTRRWRRGILILVGMILLFLWPWLAQLVGWYVS